jgi:hypothetical protein
MIVLAKNTYKSKKPARRFRSAALSTRHLVTLESEPTIRITDLSISIFHLLQIRKHPLFVILPPFHAAGRYFLL